MDPTVSDNVFVEKRFAVKIARFLKKAPIS